MSILVDADACPVKDIIVDVAQDYKIECTMYFDVSHIYNDGYSRVIYCSKGMDSVDFKLLNDVKSKDIVVTQDYGLASMCLLKTKYVINQNGLKYTENNIDNLLQTRYISQKQRKSSHHIKGPKKRTNEQDDKFREEFEKLIISLGVEGQ